MVKIKFRVLLSLTALILSIYFVSFGYAFSGVGTGTLVNPYNITNCTQLDEIRNDLDANYSLIVDINFSTAGCTQYRTGTGWVPIGDYDGGTWTGNAFSGTLFGNNHRIINFYINNPSGPVNFKAGFFNNLGHNSSLCGKVYDLGFVNVSVNSDYGPTGVIAAYAGVTSLAGAASGCSVINNTYVTGNIFTEGPEVGGLVGYGAMVTISYSYANLTINGRYDVGGLVGYGRGATITHSNSSGFIYAGGDGIGGNHHNLGGLVGDGESVKINNSYSSAIVNGTYNVGGLVGNGKSAVFYNVYATGKVNGTNNSIGGLIGNAENANITYAYSTGNVYAGKNESNYSNVGGFAGFAEGAIFSNVYSSGNVSGTGSEGIGGLIGSGTLVVPGSNYWDVNTSHQITSSGGAGLTTLEMKNINTFNIWSIVAVSFGATNTGFTWNIVNASTYPFLSWESARANPDLTTPILLTISSTSDYDGATINWTTDELVNSSVSYGLSVALLGGTNRNSNLFNNSYTIIGDLDEGTLYYYNITFCDTAGNCITNGTYNFTTGFFYPQIASVSSGDPSTTSATITWTTSEEANASVSYGTSQTNLATRVDDTGFGLSQSIALTGLTANTLYYYNVTSCDSSGNCNTSGPNSFTTDAISSGGGSSGGGGGGGGGGGATSFWTTTQILSTTDLAEFQETGITKELSAKSQIRIVVNGSNHHVGIINLTSNSAIINISSTPQQAVFSVGTEKMFDVNDDGLFDVRVKLNSINGTKANVSIGLIKEEIIVTQEVVENEAPTEENKETDEPIGPRNLLWLWVTGSILIVVGVIGIVIWRRRK